MEVLCLGNAGVGKTLLIKTFRKFCAKDRSLDVSFDTEPTVGVELDKVKINETNLTMREVGAAMSPTWPSYFKKARCVLFLIDKTNSLQLSFAQTELLKLLSHDDLRQVPLVLALSKDDEDCCMSSGTLFDILQLPDLLAIAKAESRFFRVLNISVVKPETLQELADTLEHCCS